MRPRWIGIVVLGMALFLAGCGSSTPPSSSTSAVSGVVQADGSSIRVGMVRVSGRRIRVLQDAQGHTLYYYTVDTPTHSACDAVHTCAEMWPPVTADQAPIVPGISGRFTLFDGQVEYQAHLLYTYVGDSAPGQAWGEGVGNDWWVATPSLKKNGRV